MVTHSSTPPEALPAFERPEDLTRYARSYGIDQETLHAARTSTVARRKMIEALRRSGMNGQSERVGHHLLQYQQEFDRKESWLRKIPLIGKPLDWTWQKIKKHPVLTTLGVLALVAGGLGFYYSGLGRKLLEYLPNYSGSVNRVGRGALPLGTPDGVPGGAGILNFPPPTNLPELPGGLPGTGAGRTRF